MYYSMARSPENDTQHSWHIGSCKVSLCLSDITKVPAQAIVNAANSELWMGGGVAGAIRLAGGRSIEREAMAHGPQEVGSAVITGAGKLPADYVIHAITIAPGKKSSYHNIKSATHSVLKKCKEKGIVSVAFPLLGSGIGGMSFPEAARAMLDALKKQASEDSLPNEIIFSLANKEAYLSFFRELSNIFPI